MLYNLSETNNCRLCLHFLKYGSVYRLYAVLGIKHKTYCFSQILDLHFARCWYFLRGLCRAVIVTSSQSCQELHSSINSQQYL